MEKWFRLNGNSATMNSTKFPLFGLLGAALLLTFAALPTVGKTHILLLDDSGSMKHNYSRNLRGWLVEPLLKSSAFAPEDRVIVRWFDKRGSATFNPADPQRKYDGKYDLQAIISKTPTAEDANGADTDIPEALELTIKDIDKLKVIDEVLIWLVTDNVQDVGGGGDIAPFYERIKNNNEFQAAYIFPLTNENGAKLPPDAEAMVMYLLQYNQKAVRPGLDRMADDVGRRIGNVPVTWFPIDKGVELNEAGIRVNEEASALVDGKLKLPDVPEGVVPEFTLQFPFQSKLRNLRIVQSKIIPQKSTKLTLPATIETLGDLGSWHGNITPTDLTLEAGKKSAVTYTTRLAGDMTFRPASFWNAVWNSTSEPIEATFDYRLMDVEAQMDVSALNQVRNLRGIEGNVRQSQKNVRSRSIPMSFQVQFNSLWRRIVVGLLGFFLLACLLGGAAILLMKSRYELSTPFGDEILSLPAFGARYLNIGGERAAVIKKMFGSLTVTPLGSHTINGSLSPHRLTSNVNSFAIESQIDHRQYPYVLRRITRATTQQQSPGHDDFLD